MRVRPYHRSPRYKCAKAQYKMSTFIRNVGENASRKSTSEMVQTEQRSGIIWTQNP